MNAPSANASYLSSDCGVTSSVDRQALRARLRHWYGDADPTRVAAGGLVSAAEAVVADSPVARKAAAAAAVARKREDMSRLRPAEGRTCGAAFLTEGNFYFRDW